jgi:EAL and modified HD-GYP domain-containing signal transduction protein
MEKIYISKQKIVDEKYLPYAYEIVFRDGELRPIRFSNSLQGASQLIINSISNTEIINILGEVPRAFINVDEVTLTKGILDVLDKDRFILNVLEDINLTEEVIKKIVTYKKKGFLFSLEHFDSSARMIIKFKRLFNYIDIIKMDILLSEVENLEKVMKKFKKTRIKLLAQGVSCREDFSECVRMGFDYFEGVYIDTPSIVEIKPSKEPTQFVILRLIKIIKDNETTEELEFFIKQQADLSFKLIQFFNNLEKLDIQVESLTQVITLMGRNKLLRWLIVYLYSEVSGNSASKTILELAIRRAESMEAEASKEYKDKAYIAGMFSMLSSIFDTDIKELMSYVKMDKDITELVVSKRGLFSLSLRRAEAAEKAYLKKIMLENFEKLDTTDLIYTLEDNGIGIDKEEIK